MKKNEKGFTLIELLAVIVILAIIALITTPIVLNVISGARDDAAKNKMYGVIDAVRLAYTQNQVSDNPVAADANGKIVTDFATSMNFGNDTTGTTISISGDKPTEGTVTVDTTTGKITASGIKFAGDNHTCKVEDDGKANCS